jgi:hypothetical protein
MFLAFKFTIFKTLSLRNTVLVEMRGSTSVRVELFCRSTPLVYCFYECLPTTVEQGHYSVSMDRSNAVEDATR